MGKGEHGKCRGSGVRLGVWVPFPDRELSALWMALGATGGWDELNVFLSPSLTSFTCSVFLLVFIHLAPCRMVHARQT